MNFPFYYERRNGHMILILIGINLIIIGIWSMLKNDD